MTHFTQYVPTAAADYCQQLWQRYGFHLRVVRPRLTRLGDFRALPQGQTQITINADLNPYSFLITYVHEVAHAEVNRSARRRMQPHGKAWKTAFQRLMQPLLTTVVFPEAILVPLVKYMNAPTATTSANPALMLALRRAGESPAAPTSPNRVLLSDVPEGASFRFAKKTYVRGTMRRTRVVCKETASGKTYAILAHAEVEKQ